MWVNRGGRWLRVFGQGTPTATPGAVAAPKDGFAAELTPQGVRYVYGGPGRLEDVRARVTVLLSDGAQLIYQSHWGTWRAGEVKEVDLHLASATSVQRIDFSATAKREGKEFTGSITSRR